MGAPPLVFLLLLVCLCGTHPARAAFDAATAAADWADITTGLAGQTLAIGLGTPDTLVLRGGAFPVIVAQDGANTMMGAARVSPAGRAVFFQKEAWMSACGSAASPATALECRLAVNALRWAAGVAADAGTNGTAASFRLAISKNVLGSTAITAIKTAATALGLTVLNPTGQASNVLSDVLLLQPAANGSAIADVLLTDSYTAFSAAQRAAVTAFVQTAGGGIVLGGQAWSTGGNISAYGGNLLMDPFNVVQWTAEYGDARSIVVPASAPEPTPFNADLSAKAFLDHVQGTTLLAVDMLTKVSNTVTFALQETSFAWRTPTSSASAALWASFGSQLEAQLSTQAASWTCGKVDGTLPANKMAVAYMSKRQSDLNPADVTALPCASTFPGVATAALVPSVVVNVNATYAGSYTGPMPPRGGTKWLSTGMWAPVGQVVTVTIPTAVAATLTAAGGVLGVQIGSHSDGISHKSTWCRLPYGVLQRKSFTNAAGGNTLTMASGLGGLIYVTIAWGNSFGPLDATITGAMQAPFFFKGKTTEADWRAALRTSPVPFAELGSDKFVMTVPSAAIAGLDNPQEVVDMWDRVLDGYADLTVYSRDRPRPERIVLDCDISAGWMHSGYPIMAYTSVADELLLPKHVGRMNGWGPFHELGHNHQWSAWTLPNQGEVTCNLFSLFMSETFMKMNRTTRYTNRAAVQGNYFASGVFPTNFDTDTGIHQIMQITENAGGRLNYTGGWDFWRRFLSRMQTLQGTAAVATDDAKIQTWIVETSKAAGMNMVNFYKTWKFPVTADTEASLALLPAFDFDPTTCGQECQDCCLPGSLSPTIDDICKQSTPAGWTFNSKKDSSGNDLGSDAAAAATGNWTVLAAVCAANPYCIGINSGGWYKHTLASPAAWTTTYSDPCQGLLVKNDQSPPALPSALVNATAQLQDGSLCVETPSFANGARPALANCSWGNKQVFKASGTTNNRIQVNFTGSGTYCLDVYSSQTAAGTTVTLYGCHTGANQAFAVDSAGRLRPRHASTMCLDTEGSSLAAGARLVINPCSDASSQRFVATSATAAACTGSPTVANGVFSCAASTPSGSTCAGSCSTGYTGSPVATCTAGTFSVSGTCSPSACTGSPTVANGAFSCAASTPSGSTCAGSCSTGYTGSPVATCTAGTFSVSGTCSPSACTGSPTVANGAFSCAASTPSGSTCAGSCSTGYTGSPVATCTAGTFSVSGTCSPSACTGSPTVANGAFSCAASTPSGSTCAGSCSTGYTGSPVATCTAGTFSVSGTCSPSACTGSPTVANGAFSCAASTPSGSTCAGSCSTGYTGSPVATCTAGTFSVSGTCVPAGPITRPSTLRITGSSTMCTNIKGTPANGARLTLASCSTSSQAWISSPYPNQSRIQTSGGASTFCIEVTNSATAAGSAVAINACGSGSQQKWTRDSAGRWTPAHAAGMCLDTASSSTKAGALFVINRCSTAKSQVITPTLI